MGKSHAKEGRRPSLGLEAKRRTRLHMYLCRDAANLHEKVLPEVVFGEFHPTVRAPLRVMEVTERKQK
jgi:hypothetical protein